MTVFLGTIMLLILPQLDRVNTMEPNIVMIVVDDMGWGDFHSFTQGKGLIPTPNLDQLAARGLRLTSNYVQPTCTPSRASLMTGRYAYNTGLTFAIFPPH